jgi:L-arabinose transport system substrate-binding protein
MKKKTGILLLMLVVLITSMSVLVQGAVKKPKKNIVIAGIYKMGDAVWFIEEGKASEKKCKQMGAKKFLYINVKTDANLFMQALDNVIAQRVDGVLTCIPEQQLSQVAVNKLTKAKIPVIAVDDALQNEKGNKLAPWVGIDAYNIGATAGKWMANYIKDNGLVNDKSTGILFLTADTVSSCVPRTVGEKDEILKMLPEFPKNRLFYADHKTDMESGCTAANSIITGNPQIKKWMVLSVSDDGAVGAVRALEQAGLDKESCAIGLGGYLAPGEFAKKYSAFKASAYFSAKDVGETAAKVLMEKILYGKKIPAKYAVGAKIVTKNDNLKKVMPEYVK